MSCMLLMVIFPCICLTLHPFTGPPRLIPIYQARYCMHTIHNTCSCTLALCMHSLASLCLYYNGRFSLMFLPFGGMFSLLRCTTMPGMYKPIGIDLFINNYNHFSFSSTKTFLSPIILQAPSQSKFHHNITQCERENDKSMSLVKSDDLLPYLRPSRPM
jgi:hypothetical protein